MEIDGLGKTLEELTSRVESLDQAEKKRSLAVQGELDDVQDQLSTFGSLRLAYVPICAHGVLASSYVVVVF